MKGLNKKMHLKASVQERKMSNRLCCRCQGPHVTQDMIKSLEADQSEFLGLPAQLSSCV